MEVLLSIGGSIAVIIITFPFWIRWLAERDIFVTYVPEGRSMAVVRGKEFVRTIMFWTDKSLDQKSGDVIDGTPPKRNPLLAYLGLHWVGLWPWMQIYRYDFPFNTVDQNGEIKERPNEVTKYVFLTDYVYFVQVKEAETEENFPVQMGLLLTIRVLNPYKALFRVANWLNTVSDLIASDARDFIGGKTFEGLIKGQDVQVELKKHLNTTLRRVKSDYGVEIAEVGIHSVNPAGDMKEKLREAATKEYVASREAEAMAALGEGRRRALENEALGLNTKEGRMALRARVMGELAASGNTVVMSGNKTPDTLINIDSKKGG